MSVSATTVAAPSLPPPDYDNDNAHTHPTLGRYVYGPSTAATLNLAATAAQCARIWTGIDPGFSAACLAAAETAWNAALEHPALLAGNTPGEGGGNYEDGDVSDEFAWAAAELYVTTQDPAYLDQLAAFSERAPLPGHRTRASYSMHWDETAALGMISLAAVDGSDDYQAMLVGVADDYLAVLRDEGYRLPMDIGGYVWGSNSGVLNNAMILALAYDITGDPAYLDGVIAAADYVLGRNALSTSFVTGYGAVFPQHVHHRFWANQGEFPPPPPGALAQRPIELPTPTSTPDVLLFAALAVDRTLLAAAWIWFALGSLVFFAVAGLVAGLSFRQAERRRFDLLKTDAAALEDAGLLPPPPPPRTPTGEDHWPDSLP